MVQLFDSTTAKYTAQPQSINIKLFKLKIVTSNNSIWYFRIFCNVYIFCLDKKIISKLNAKQMDLADFCDMFKNYITCILYVGFMT